MNATEYAKASIIIANTYARHPELPLPLIREFDIFLHTEKEVRTALTVFGYPTELDHSGEEYIRYQIKHGPLHVTIWIERAPFEVEKAKPRYQGILGQLLEITA